MNIEVIVNENAQHFKIRHSKFDIRHSILETLPVHF
jgi:hypothetical protein